MLGGKLLKNTRKQVPGSYKQRAGVEAAAKEVESHVGLDLVFDQLFRKLAAEIRKNLKTV